MEILVIMIMIISILLRLFVYRNSFIFESLIENITSKMQFSINADELQDLEDEITEVTHNINTPNFINGKEIAYESEWQSFLRQNIEVLAELAELTPEKTFQIICPLFNSYSSDYFDLQSRFKSEQTEDEENTAFVFDDALEWQSLYALLKDLRTILQILGK